MDESFFDRMQSGDSSTAMLAITSLPDLMVQDEDGDNALHLCAKYGYIECIIHLLSQEVPINTVNLVGQSALHFAILGHQPLAVNLLIQQGANPTIVDKHGDTPLELAKKDVTLSDDIVEALMHYTEEFGEQKSEETIQTLRTQSSDLRDRVRGPRSKRVSFIIHEEVPPILWEG